MVLVKYATASRRWESDFDVTKESCWEDCADAEGALVVRDCWLRTMAGHGISQGAPGRMVA